MTCLAENWVFNLRMTYGEKRYIWQADDWPHWRYDLSALMSPLTEVSRAQGLLLGRLADVGLALRDQASLAALTEDVVKTSEIEGEVLNVESVRSSLPRRSPADRRAPVGLARSLVPDRLLWHGQNSRRPVARGSRRADAGGVRPGGAAQGALPGSARRGAARPDGEIPVVGERGYRRTCARESRPRTPLARDTAPVRRRQWPHRPRRRRLVPRPSRRQSATLLQLVGANQARARGLLRRARTKTEGPARCHRLAVVVPRHAVARSGQRADHAGRSAGQGALLATLGGHTVERTAGQAAESPARRLRGQAQQQPVGSHRPMLARHRAARHHAVAGAGRAEEIARRRA